MTEAGGVGEGDRDDPVVGARGARELVARRGDDFDIERQAPEIAEGQAAERGPPGHEEVLMDGIGEEAIGRPGHVRARAARLAAAVAGGEGVSPGAVTREPAEDAGAVERLERQEPSGGLDERRVRQEQERGEGHGLRMDAVRLAPVEADRTPALGEVEGQESWRRIPAEEERRVLEREPAARRGPPPRPRGRRRSRPGPPRRGPCR